ncbi:OLC1v1015337C1 [Oldenlandia corymbosa var. corymbosa]|uniref:OLC1v1015337C1 n=1 Tax=Oldenlandia corymbosa var. corymbosa TaxID=529605 RepID=A0AAV1E6F1_OLDCO|nr:OLC1v1015337C1 [Oldenlandia corymbosa var. corymbosa]
MEEEKKNYFVGGGDAGDLYGGFMMVVPNIIDPLGLLLRHHHPDASPPPHNPPHLILNSGFRRHHRPSMPAFQFPPPPKLDALILAPIHPSKPLMLLQEFLRTREVGEFISGALAGAMTKAVLAPLETIRTRMVVGVGPKNICGSFVEVIEKQGWQGLWAGNMINMVRIIPTQAIELGTFEFVKRAMTSAQEKWLQEDCQKFQLGNLSLNLTLSWLSPVAVAGAAAGVASTLACHPLEVLKDRLTISPEVYPSISVAVRKMYKDGGVGALYAGIFPTLVGMLPYSTCYYFMYDTMKKSYCLAKNKGSLNRTEMLLIGALSGEIQYLLLVQKLWQFCLVLF